MLLAQLHYATTTGSAEEDSCSYCYCSHPYLMSYKFNSLLLQPPKFTQLIFQYTLFVLSAAYQKRELV